MGCGVGQGKGKCMGSGSPPMGGWKWTSNARLEQVMYAAHKAEENIIAIRAAPRRVFRGACGINKKHGHHHQSIAIIEALQNRLAITQEHVSRWCLQIVPYWPRKRRMAEILTTVVSNRASPEHPASLQYITREATTGWEIAFFEGCDIIRAHG